MSESERDREMKTEDRGGEDVGMRAANRDMFLRARPAIRPIVEIHRATPTCATRVTHTAPAGSTADHPPRRSAASRFFASREITMFARDGTASHIADHRVFP